MADQTPTPALDALAAPVVAATAPLAPLPNIEAWSPPTGDSAARRASVSVLWRIEQDAAPFLALALGAVDLVTGSRAGRAVDLGAVAAGFAALGMPFLTALL